jgi:hypothetical protein
VIESTQETVQAMYRLPGGCARLRREALMRANFALCFVLCFIPALQLPAATVAVIPNGGAGVGSLSVIDPSTGAIERNLVTAVAPTDPTTAITNESLVVTNAGASAAVIGLQQSRVSAVYVLSALDLSTGRIRAQRELSFVPLKGFPLIAANPKASVLYLGYVDHAGNFQLQALDPVTLHPIQQSNLGAHQGQAMIVSPDGQTIYLITSAGVVAVQASDLTLLATVPLAVSFFDATVSPDSSTLYVTSGEYPDITVAVIETATLQVTDSIPVSEISVVFGIGISPDGSQLYLSGQANFQGTDIFTLDLATQSLTGVLVVVDGGVAVSPDGSVYVGDGSAVLLFNPLSQSVTRTLTAYGVGVFALNPTGSLLYYLNSQSSSLAAAGPPPSETLLGETATGQLDSIAYDATDNLLLAADTAHNIEVLEGDTFQPAGHLFLPNLNSTPPYLNSSGGSGFVTMAGQVLRFDPVSVQITGKVSLPNSSNYLVSFSPSVMNGSSLYVPFSFSFNGGPVDPPGSPGGSPQSVPPDGVWVIDTQQMKLVATWPFPTLPLVGLAQGASVGYAVFAAGDDELDVDEIDLSTGKIVASVEVPGASSNFSNPAVSPDGSVVYLFSGNTLYTFNGVTLAITHTVTGVALTNLTVSPDGTYLYGGTPFPCQECSEQIISTSSLEVVATIPLSTGYPQPVLFLGN